MLNIYIHTYFQAHNYFWRTHYITSRVIIYSVWLYSLSSNFLDIEHLFETSLHVMLSMFLGKFRDSEVELTSRLTPHVRFLIGWSVMISQ